MTAPRSLRASIAKSLLVQLCVLELVATYLFTRRGGPLLGGIVAPFFGLWLPFVAASDWSRRPSAPEVLTAGLIAVALFVVGLVAWLRFRGRIAAHAGFLLFHILSIATFFGDAT